MFREKYKRWKSTELRHMECIALGINDDSETYDDIAIGSLRVADVLIKKLKGK